MKIDRLIGILSILLQKEKVTAPYLAETFEVSRRTIQRDIENLCKAGIPLVTTQGQNGGISIMEGYRMDRTLLTSFDMQAILAGLKSLDSVSKTTRYQQLMEKLSVGNSSILTSNNHIMIDLSSWYKSTLAPKIELIQTAIERFVTIRFHYFAPNGESFREIEPSLLIFQWSSWYIWGFCLEKQECRMFKLNRILELTMTDVTFDRRDLPQPNLNADYIFPDDIIAKLLLEPNMKWRLIEEYGIDSFTQLPDGNLLFESNFADTEHLFGWLLSFGTKAELLEPVELRLEFAALTEQLYQKYHS